jgi:hypothetical protein
MTCVDVIASKDCFVIFIFHFIQFIVDYGSSDAWFFFALLHLPSSLSLSLSDICVYFFSVLLLLSSFLCAPTLCVYSFRKHACIYFFHSSSSSHSFCLFCHPRFVSFYYFILCITSFLHAFIHSFNRIICVFSIIHISIASLIITSFTSNTQRK